MLQYLMIFLKGLAMGAADVVPGVSGGTIAFITGIYTRWLNALSNINITAVRKLFKEGFASAWQYVDGSFMLCLFLGIATSVVSLAKVIKWLLLNHPISLWSFFFGLVLASIIILMRQIKTLQWHTIVFFVFGTLAAIFISLLPNNPDAELNYLFLFFAGALAICAMILPGVSGSFILVLIGAYEVFLDAINTINVPAIASFGLGAIIGLLSFARLLKWLFANYYNTTLSLMTGFVAGSLLKIWPWKQVAQASYPRLPSFSLQTDQLVTACLFMLIGFIMIVALEVTAKKFATKSSH